MKILSKFGIVLALTGSLFLSSCAERYFVSARPVEPVYERPLVPYGGAVWIDGDWAWNSGRYVYTRGYWAKPRYGRAYVRGGWVQRGRDYAWHRGHWR